MVKYFSNSGLFFCICDFKIPPPLNEPLLIHHHHFCVISRCGKLDSAPSVSRQRYLLLLPLPLFSFLDSLASSCLSTVLFQVSHGRPLYSCLLILVLELGVDSKDMAYPFPSFSFHLPAYCLHP